MIPRLHRAAQNLLRTYPDKAIVEVAVMLVDMVCKEWDRQNSGQIMVNIWWQVASKGSCRGLCI